jgi:hypothetical protein
MCREHRNPTLRHPHRSRLPWIRAFLLEARRSDLMVSAFRKSQNRNKRAGDRKGIIELLLIILGAIVVVTLGLYGGLASSHHHIALPARKHKTQLGCAEERVTWHRPTESGRCLRYHVAQTLVGVAGRPIHTRLGTMSLHSFRFLV